MKTVEYYLCKRLGAIKRILERLEERKCYTSTETQLENILSEQRALNYIKDCIVDKLESIREKHAKHARTI